MLEPTDPPPADDGDGGHDGPVPNGADAHADGPKASDPATLAERAKKGGGSAAMLGAAMLAMGEILEPEKTTVEIVQTNDDPIDDLPFKIDFGNLPPLDD